jgi:hypothetical protein
MTIATKVKELWCKEKDNDGKQVVVGGEAMKKELRRDRRGRVVRGNRIRDRE